MSTVYSIFRPSPGAGFFSNFFWVLEHIDYADRRGWTPLVDMEEHSTYFNEDEPVDGTRNAWEYYFEQPGVSGEEPDGLVSSEGRKLELFTPNRPFGWRTLRRARSLVRKYIRLKPAVRAELDSYLLRYDLSRTVGVHIRGTDMNFTQEHPIPRPPRYFLEKTIAVARRRNCSLVFLACDEAAVVDMFRDTFGAGLIVQEAHRTGSEVVYDPEYRWLMDKPRPLHNYLLGKEVLLDALLLASCKCLVCGWSNVAKAAQAFGPDGQIVYECVPRGIRKDGRPDWVNRLRLVKFHLTRIVHAIAGV